MHCSAKWSRALTIGGVGTTLVAILVSALFVSGTAFANPVAPYVAHQVKVHPTIQKVTKDTSAVHFGCQDRPIDGSAGPRCYSPAQIQNAYNIAPLLKAGINGSGRTIAIIDAFSSPYVQSDLKIFDQTFGLPDPAFEQIAPQGLTPFDPTDGNQVGWAEEITLDVLWSHAAAPGAKILLVLATSNDDSALYNATKYVIDHSLADVISQSFGEAETCMDPNLIKQQHALFAEAAEKNITVFASSGDSGASQFNCAGTAAILAASTPASDPLVTGVGGTTLSADANGNYVGETAWTEQLFGCNPPALAPDDINCSGGGFSTIYKQPAFQAGVPNTRHGQRGVPDVAYDAGVNGGVLTHCGICNFVLGFNPTDPTIFFIFGGTSAGSPQWSGLITLADQLAHRRLGFINPALYRISRIPGLYKQTFHDITTGNNDVSEIGTGYNAARNWDPVTGLGTPNAVKLLPMLAVFSYVHDGDDGAHGRA
ncbi:MAG TPA: S53 family peptidase [Ktedonobacterales bacterium]|nr:S53 family peptidase [Ktedonobacterales bacterium]